MPFQRPGRGVLSMSAKARTRHVAQWLPVLLFLGFITAAAVDTDATAASKNPVVENVAAGDASLIVPASQVMAPAETARSEGTRQPIVVASLATGPLRESDTVAPPATRSSPPASIAPLVSSTPARAPARIFTINDVLAKHAGRASRDKSEGNIQLASVDPTATPEVSSHSKSGEPFGLLTVLAPDGLVWLKWRKVAADIGAGEPALLRCLADATQCSPAATR